MFNPLDLCKLSGLERDDGRTEVLVDPDRMYPAVIEAIRDGSLPTDDSVLDEATGEILRDEDAAHYRAELARVRKATQALADALLPLVERRQTVEEQVVRGGAVVATRQVEEIVFEPPADTLPANRRQARADVLEVARKWFTNELHRALERPPLAVHILKGSGRWKL